MMTAQSFESIGAAWRLGRAVHRVRRPRKSYVAGFVHAVARKLPTWQKVRTSVMQLAAFSSVTFGLFQQGYVLAGWISVCVSLLVLEYLGGSEGSKR